MTIADLLKLAQSRLTYLNNLRSHAVSVGDTSAIESLGTEIAETQSTIDTLQSLS